MSLYRQPDATILNFIDQVVKLTRERDALTLEIVAAKCTLAKWLEWARLHGHLEHAAGIADSTREILLTDA